MSRKVKADSSTASCASADYIVSSHKASKKKSKKGSTTGQPTASTPIDIPFTIKYAQPTPDPEMQARLVQFVHQSNDFDDALQRDSAVLAYLTRGGLALPAEPWRFVVLHSVCFYKFGSPGSSSGGQGG